jgi:hypothetical protein
MKRQEVSNQAKQLAYQAKWKETHLREAEALNAQIAEESEGLQRVGLRPVAELEPDELEELAHQRKVDAANARAAEELQIGSTVERQSAWSEERKRILVARAAHQRACEADGSTVVFASGPPPTVAPEWFQAPKDGTVYHRYRREPSNLEGNQEIRFEGGYDAIAQRQAQSGPSLLTPEQSFEAEAERQRKEKS